MRLREFKMQSILSEREENGSPKATKSAETVYVNVFKEFSFGSVFFVATKKMKPGWRGRDPPVLVLMFVDVLQGQNLGVAPPNGAHTLLSCHKRVCRKGQFLMLAKIILFTS